MNITGGAAEARRLKEKLFASALDAEALEVKLERGRLSPGEGVTSAEAFLDEDRKRLASRVSHAAYRMRYGADRAVVALAHEYCNDKGLSRGRLSQLLAMAEVRLAEESR